MDELVEGGVATVMAERRKGTGEKLVASNVLGHRIPEAQSWCPLFHPRWQSRCPQRRCGLPSLQHVADPVSVGQQLQGQRRRLVHRVAHIVEHFADDGLQGPETHMHRQTQTRREREGGELGCVALRCVLSRL